MLVGIIGTITYLNFYDSEVVLNRTITSDH